MSVDLQAARKTADALLSNPPNYGVVDYSEANDFWAFFGGYSDGIVRDENPQIVVVMKSDGSVIRPQIPSDEGFALLSQLPDDEDE